MHCRFIGQAFKGKRSLTIRQKGDFFKNAVLKGMNLQEGATTIERNRQIGGHKA